MKTYISWSKYIKALNKIVEYFKDEKFDVIVGLTRGGLIPAVYVSHAWNVPIMPFNPHSLHADGTPRENIILPISSSVVRKVLIIDDLSDTGKTLSKCFEFFTNKGFVCSTTSVYINEDITEFKPDFTVFNSNNKWIVFPYEFYENIDKKGKDEK